MWYVLAAANAVTDADLVPGTTLKAPEVKTTANDANTFKPYDPNAILGPTTPSLPYITPPPKQGGGCNALATVIRVVVAIIVIAVTRNPYLAAAVAGIGETAAQTVEIQDGDRQGYNWAQVGTSAVMAGFGASQAGQQMFGSFTTKFGTVGGKFAYGATMAVASDAVNYSLSKSMGYETHFSLRSTAANGLASGISAAVLGPAPGQGGAPGSGGFNWTEVAMAAVKSVVRQGINYGVHKAIEGHASWNTGLALGNALGDAVGTGLQGRRVEQEMARQAALPAMGAFTDAASTVTSGLITVPGNGDVRRSNAIDVASGNPANSDVRRLDVDGDGVITDNDVVRVTAVPDQYSSSGWYFYGWNGSAQQWVDLQRQRVDPVLWSMPPKQAASNPAIDTFIRELQVANERAKPSYMQPLSQRLGLRPLSDFQLAEYKRTGKLPPQMSAYDPSAAQSMQQLAAKLDALEGNSFGGGAYGVARAMGVDDARAMQIATLTAGATDIAIAAGSLKAGSNLRAANSEANAAETARSWQTKAPYVNQDPMRSVSLKEGKVIAQVVLDPSEAASGNYFTTVSAIRRATLPDGSIDANILNQGLQIDGSRHPSFRPNIQYFRVDASIPYGQAAFGRAIANTHLNPGGYAPLPQIFIKNDFLQNLRPVDLSGNAQVVAYPMMNTKPPKYLFEWIPPGN